MNWWADPAPTLREIDTLIDHAFRAGAEYMAEVVMRAPSEEGDVANGVIAVRNNTNNIVGFVILISAPMDATVFILEAHINTPQEPTDKDLFNFAFVAVEGVGIATRDKKVKDLFISAANPEGLSVATAMGAMEAHNGLFKVPGVWLRQTIAVAATAYQKAKAATIH